MLLLILGLILFLGMHSARLFAADQTRVLHCRLGPLAWKGLCTGVDCRLCVDHLRLRPGPHEQNLAVDLPVWTRHLWHALLTIPGHLFS